MSTGDVKFNVKGANGLTTVAAGEDVTVTIPLDVTFDNVTANQAITAPKVKATTGVETPQVTGLTNTTWTPGQTQPVSGRAATEDQLKAVDNQVATNKQNIADNKTAIDKNTTAIARKIFLNGNTGTTTKKSLRCDVDFTVKGEDGITTPLR